MEDRAEGRIAGSAARWSAAVWLVLACISCSSAPPPSASAPESAPAVAPEALAGDWMLETRIGDQAVEGRLHFSVTGGVLAGSVSDADGNAREMKNLARKGGKISWDAGNRHYEGTAGEFAMKGTARLVTRRDERGGDEDSAAPPPGRVGGGGYAGGGFGGGGRRSRGRGRGGGSAPSITWSAYKSLPAPTPTPTSGR